MHEISNRVKRMIEFAKSPYVRKKATVKCCVSYCNKSELRDTTSGVFCFEHYVDGKECSTPGCHYPAVELGICRFCLNKDFEGDKKSLFFRSSLLRCQEI